MNKQEFEQVFRDNKCPVTISMNELWDKTPRTLLQGKTDWLHVWHLYMDERRQLWLHVYWGENNTLFYRCFGARVQVSELFNNPEYKVYTLNPERCDYMFCTLLIGKGVRLPFSHFSSAKIDNTKFFGMRVDECLMKQEG